MCKFTIFTIILTVLVVVMSAEFFLKEQLTALMGGGVPEDAEDVAVSLPSDLDLSQILETNVLGAEEVGVERGGAEVEREIDVAGELDISGEGFLPIEGSGDSLERALIDLDGGGETTIEGVSRGDQSGAITRIGVETTPKPVGVGAEPVVGSSSGLPDFEDEGAATTIAGGGEGVFIRDDMVKSSGFPSGYLEEEPHNGFIFKSVYIDDVTDLDMTKYSIRTESELLAKVYVMQAGALADINEVYELLKVRANEGIDTSINETNDFGDGSFYMNDIRRSNVAFLIVRHGRLLYGFSYPKTYHAQIKNINTLIKLER